MTFLLVPFTIWSVVVSVIVVGVAISLGVKLTKELSRLTDKKGQKAIYIFVGIVLSIVLVAIYVIGAATVFGGFWK
ncbi:MAG: hypothetical protein IPP62_04210 [bacterium]|nr:hypothetical protein [bacterium]